MNMKEANKKAVEIILKGQPTLVGIGKALDVIPGMKEDIFLHAGPPITWERMSGPLKGAIIGGLIYEGKATNQAEAEKIAESNGIKFAPCHHHDTVGPMAGVVTPSMPVFIMENKTFGNKSYCTLNEGLGKVLRYGAFSDEVIDRLKWMEKTLAPVLKEGLKIYGGEMNIKNLIAQALLMGDEGHNRNKGGTSLFIREIAPSLIRSSFDRESVAKVIEFIHSNDHFFLNLTMPAAKCIIQAAEGIKGCSILTTMARNGTDFGIRVSSMPDKWFVGKAQDVDGLYFPGYSLKDANPDIGDSVITETAGFGGFAMAAAPAIVQFVGGTPKDAIRMTLEMYEICEGENDTFKIPALNFKGSPTGIDLAKIIETGILPSINTGIAHKDPGIGQVGAGLVKPPRNCFEEAFEEFVNSMEKELSNE
ncbi:MAG: hypothetical protein C0601_00870 [Candidatus Muiribacterium halophilum]|uniref:DUF1116 domain-containing protein n=1 Tax=Muiribacterium halophilum TaxID=2053465 RepID=A0A2N5ZM41_MUIH1|nr:MAG: hypothetical protein C0601_00870 [Candidatus Muirbacterium halophilum]